MFTSPVNYYYVFPYFEYDAHSRDEYKIRSRMQGFKISSFPGHRIFSNKKRMINVLNDKLSIRGETPMMVRTVTHKEVP
jgi:hypothetical protein